MSDYQNTIALKRVFKKGKTTFDAGPEIAFNIITDHNDSARFVGLGESDVVDIPNIMTTGKIPWRHITWNWAIERREVAMNRSPRKIVDLAKTRRLAAFGSAIIKFEQRLWRVPASTDTVNPYGIPYYVVKSNTAATSANNDGFNGTVPSGYTTVANISPTTYPRYANYATQYTAVTKDDFVRKARRMAVYTDFMPLIEGMPTYDVGGDYMYCTNYALLGTLEELSESQNDNLGPDVASMDGKTMFRRSPVVFVKELDLDTTNPFYSLYWGEMRCCGLRDEWMKETSLPQAPGQHTISATFTDCSWNLLCRNRRRQGVIATDTTMPS